MRCKVKREFKIFLLFVSWCIIVPLIFIILFSYDSRKLKLIGEVSDYAISDKYITIIDDVQQINNTALIYGCSVKLGEDLSYVNKQYVLVDEQNKLYGMNTVIVDRKSATEYYNDGFNYDNSGLNGEFATRYLEENSVYKIGIVINEKDGNTYLAISDKTIGGELSD